MNDIFSFYQLISKYQIEIPIIQRDYAQGRNNPKAEDVRKSMVSSMIKSVTEDESPLFFDFVYGRIDGNKFIPFDGQQRLTTLFLFHKYVFEKCQSCSTYHYKSNCICNDILLRFTYATRQSSREFCERLVNEKVIPIDAKSLSKNIRNMSWFYSDWEKDPTIMGMLTMLDEIHNQFTKKAIKDYKPLAEKLISGCRCPITFHFVDMGEHKLSDETYVKMNARGKTLTPFENFKASLEQYLENNKMQDLQSRLNNRIDGVWLDLFWKINGNALPDTIMMSFFNRHFMNVWRCWYGNNTKSENERKNLPNEEIEKQKEYDSFNERIVTEMPLYPAKDDFVPWEIYQNVLDKCGVDECLTPIFNIWDELCKEAEHIIENSQSVWNRGDGKAKWDLYEGAKNNENRETYPSRVAFYALLRYFGVKEERTTTTLAQWMRIVWNIIENSTIDSSDTYQAALRLMNKLSNKCHNIHDALANDFADFQLGSQYHAQDQVQEEIIKATKIVEDSSWERKIIAAEKYAFFKGAIRFLFTKEDIGDDWEHFDTKWANAQIYFNEDGVKDNDELYKSNAILMKSLLANCDDFWRKIWWHFDFSNDANRWKRILTAGNWRNAVDAIMGTKVTTETTGESIDAISEPYIKSVVDDGLMDYVCNDMSGAWIRSTYHGYHAIWISGYPSDQIVLNPILARLKVDNAIEYSEKNKIENCRYYKCVDKNVDFKCGCYFFRWWGYPNDKELDVYLMENDWADYKKQQDPQIEGQPDIINYYCFKVTKEMETDTSLFTKQLDCLIAQAFPEQFDKACCNDCQNKICE